MKIWCGYGSEHSMNLVMIGHFKKPQDAKKVHQTIKYLTRELDDKIEVGVLNTQYSNDVMRILSKVDCYTIGSTELEQFLYEVSAELKGDKIIVTTDESEVSAFFKLMISKGAKVEIYSAHDYPDTEYGRGK